MNPELNQETPSHTLRNFILGGIALGIAFEGLLIGTAVLERGTEIFIASTDIKVALGGAAFGGFIAGAIGYIKNKHNL